MVWLVFTGKKLWPSQNVGIPIAELAPDGRMISSHLGNCHFARLVGKLCQRIAFVVIVGTTWANK